MNWKVFSSLFLASSLLLLLLLLLLLPTFIYAFVYLSIYLSIYLFIMFHSYYSFLIHPFIQLFNCSCVLSLTQYITRGQQVLLDDGA